ncbi:hypothetical protein NONO_c73270 [Nocardia nova SH22a]|uniref:Uncharacterized protein n=1 Tax=Nocardia nova SH22a TaxID=1415166 RepID=W5TT37_9NOCA|nr:hypothetical protein [Nocardia nova]AHH22083.1 hypothetical protein NONO_c73270 [Nocardia nova SH22a]
MNDRDRLPATVPGGTPDEVAQRRLDRATWEYLEKRACECTDDELWSVIEWMRARTAELHRQADESRRQAAESRRRILIAEMKIAAHLAEIDRYWAFVNDGIGQAERHANGGAR